MADKPNDALDAARYTVLRGLLLKPPLRERVRLPLGDWAPRKERNLPHALLDKPIREILNHSLDELRHMPSIGQKKIAKLLELFERVLLHPGPSPSPAQTRKIKKTQGRRPPLDGHSISETTWRSWAKTVEENGLAFVPLARVAPSLRQLPRSLWQTPLREYSALSLRQLRQLPNHGARRQEQIVGLFAELAVLLVDADAGSPFAVRPVLQPLARLSSWIECMLIVDQAPRADEVRQHLVEPILEQTKCDGGELLKDLVHHRLLGAVGGAIADWAAKTDLTKARVYQLVQDSRQILTLRWPEGPCMVRRLRDQMESCDGDLQVIELVRRVERLFYRMGHVSGPGNGQTNTADGESGRGVDSGDMTGANDSDEVPFSP